MTIPTSIAGTLERLEISEDKLAPAAASVQVFATTELLETIVLSVNPLTLLPAQRVNKKWQGVILGSIKIQQLLFFKPLSEDAFTSYHAEIEYGKDVLNPLLAPLFRHLAHETFDFDEFGPSWQRMLPHNLQSWRRKSASWRKMLLTQPAIKNPYDVYSRFAEGSVDEEGEDLEDRRVTCRKIRMGDILQDISELVNLGLGDAELDSWAEIHDDQITDFEQLTTYHRLEEMIAYSKRKARKTRAVRESQH